MQTQTGAIGLAALAIMKVFYDVVLSEVLDVTERVFGGMILLIIFGHLLNELFGPHPLLNRPVVTAVPLKPAAKPKGRSRSRPTSQTINKS